MTSSPPRLPQPLPLPLLPQPYKLPRQPGAGRTVAPALPFTDTAAVINSLDGLGRVYPGLDPHSLTVECPPETLEVLASRLEVTGTAGMRIVVRLPGLPDLVASPKAVRRLAEAGIAALEITSPVRDRDDHLIDWIELSKSALAHGVSLIWHGDALAAAHPNLRHLVPARGDVQGDQRWRYGMLTWRRGPGYALVHDRRNPAMRQSLTLDLPPIAALFGELLDRPAIVEGAEAVLAELAAADLVTFCGPRAVWLPYRLLRSPVNVLPS